MPDVFKVYLFVFKYLQKNASKLLADLHGNVILSKSTGSLSISMALCDLLEALCSSLAASLP